MKNLKIATDQEIYRLKDLIQVFNSTSYKSFQTKKMQKEIEKEWKRRKIDITTVPLLWEFSKTHTEYNDNIR